MIGIFHWFVHSSSFIHHFFRASLVLAKASSRYLGLLDRLQDASSIAGDSHVIIIAGATGSVIHDRVFLRNWCFLKNNYNYKMVIFGAFEF